MAFKDRIEAGKLLAEKLKQYRGKDVLVLAIPRGGAIIGYEIAKALQCELDVITPRKLKDKYNPELAVGAVMHDGSIYLNQNIIKIRGLDEQYLKQEEKAELEESKRRFEKYRSGRPYPKIENRVVILADDGIATGATIMSASRYLKENKAKRIVVATPVIPNDTLAELKAEIDHIIYLEVPLVFFAIGQFYEDFEQVDDQLVVKMLTKQWNK